MKNRNILITFLSLILAISVSVGLTSTVAYAEETPVEYSMGDANLDGNVNTRDVVLIKQSIVGLTELTDKQKVFADVYADGNINTRDVVLIQQSIVGMEVDLGTHEHDFSLSNTCVCGKVNDNQEVTTYTVTFLDYDGSILSEQNVVYGKDALAPEDPEREGYRFIGWDKEIENVTTNLTIKALYIEQVSITFQDYNGSIILAYNIDKGANAEIVPENPTREYYRFTGWDVEVFENIESDLTVNAIYVRLYEIVFVNYDGTEVDRQEVVSGEDGTLPTHTPEREGYTFIGWEGSVENVTEDREIIATYEINSYVVTFKDVDGSVLSVQNVVYLVSATPPKVKDVYYDYTKDKGYRFTGWDKSYKGITQDTIITAVYDEEITEPIIFIEKIAYVSRKEETAKIRVMMHCDSTIYGVSLNVGYADKLRLSTEVNGEYCKTGENLNYTEAIGSDNVYEFRWSDTNGINFADSKVTETGTITIITLTFTWDSSSINASPKEINVLSDSYIINDKLEKQTPVIISSVIDIVN